MADPKYLEQQAAWLEDSKRLTPAGEVLRNMITNPKQSAKDIAAYWGNAYKNMDQQPYPIQAIASLPINPMWPSVALGQMNNYAVADDYPGMAVTAAGALLSPFKQGVTLGKAALMRNVRANPRGVAAAGVEVGYSPELLK
jgi:hypothetical protein